MPPWVQLEYNCFSQQVKNNVRRNKVSVERSNTLLSQQKQDLERTIQQWNGRYELLSFVLLGLLFRFHKMLLVLRPTKRQPSPGFTKPKTRLNPFSCLGVLRRLKKCSRASNTLASPLKYLFMTPSLLVEIKKGTQEAEIWRVYKGAA